ncbi:Uncharacterised protein [Hafnia alvei]|uniref:Uncharacterized protein n=1 Tax=Hafnia alvei TaxID=569 RepID=A0A377PRV9_HAFAL|nr:Uncharacterised protein [Hafnia alvei]
MDFTVIHDNLSYLLWGQFPDGPLGGRCVNAGNEPDCRADFCRVGHAVGDLLGDVAGLAGRDLGDGAGIFPRYSGYHADLLDLLPSPDRLWR